MSVSILHKYGSYEPIENNRAEMPKMFENGEVSLFLEDEQSEYSVKFDVDFKPTDDDYIVEVVNYTILGCSIVTPNGDDTWTINELSGIFGIETGKMVVKNYLSNIHDLLRDEVLRVFHNC